MRRLPDSFLSSTVHTIVTPKPLVFALNKLASCYFQAPLTEKKTESVCLSTTQVCLHNRSFVVVPTGDVCPNAHNNVSTHAKDDRRTSEFRATIPHYTNYCTNTVDMPTFHFVASATRGFETNWRTGL